MYKELADLLKPDSLWKQLDGHRALWDGQFFVSRQGIAQRPPQAFVDGTCYLRSCVVLYM